VRADFSATRDWLNLILLRCILLSSQLVKYATLWIYLYMFGMEGANDHKGINAKVVITKGGAA
jgi:hypothetical protein